VILRVNLLPTQPVPHTQNVALPETPVLCLSCQERGPRLKWGSMIDLRYPDRGRLTALSLVVMRRSNYGFQLPGYSIVKDRAQSDHRSR
jgi:hypothetical protein